jgi:transcriptional regulator with XRE-family HTH domain
MGTVADDQPSGALTVGEAGPILSRMALGLRLRGHREACGLSREQAAGAIGASVSKVSRLEAGCIAVMLQDIIDLCEVYGVGDHTERTTLLGLAREANTVGWWAAYSGATPPWCESFLGLEQAARVIRGYEVQFVPELMQIPGYARGHIALAGGDLTAADIELRLEVRMRRQQILHRDDPPHLWVVADEASLRRPIGGRATMFRQLDHLSNVCDMPRVTLQILPFASGGHAACGGAFTLLSLSGHGVSGFLPDVVFFEQLTTAVYIDEPAEVERYRHVLNLLATRDAAPADATHSILRKIIRDL